MDAILKRHSRTLAHARNTVQECRRTRTRALVVARRLAMTDDSLASAPMISVETRTVTGQVTALGSAGPFTLVVDRPSGGGGGGKGFNGGQLLYLAVAGCISNDLFREAPRFGCELDSVRVTVDGDFSGDPAVSDAITYDVELSGSGDLDALVREVDRIAEIPNTLRQGAPVSLRSISIA